MITLRQLPYIDVLSFIDGPDEIYDGGIKWLRNEDFFLNRLAFSKESRIFAAEKI